jgi:hypothetical protein
LCSRPSPASDCAKRVARTQGMAKAIPLKVE